MPAGLQIWDADGTNILNTNMRIARIVGVVTVASNGSLYDARMTTGVPFGYGQVNGAVLRPNSPLVSTAYVSFSGGTVSWVVSELAAGQSVTIYYGVY